jgi:hypothetical protein
MTLRNGCPRSRARRTNYLLLTRPPTALSLRQQRFVVRGSAEDVKARARHGHVHKANFDHCPKGNAMLEGGGNDSLSRATQATLRQ